MDDKSLTNILEIYKLVAQKLYTFDEALTEVGMKHHIETSALRLSCTRGLNISIEMFDNFLKEENAFNFKNFLIRRYTEHNMEIIRFFNTFDNCTDMPVLDLTKVFKTSTFTNNFSLYRDTTMNELENSFQDWIARNDVPQDMKDELKSWIKKIDSSNK